VNDAHDEGLTLGEWLLLVPTAAVWMVNGLAGFVLFCIFIGYSAYRQHPHAFTSLLPPPTQRHLSCRDTTSRMSTTDEDYLQHLLSAQVPPQTASEASTIPTPVSWRQWRIQAVRAHHLLVIGNTDSGKTTLVRALLPGKRGTILVIDPKNRPGKWGTIEAIGLDDNAEYTQIERALQLVLHELRQRQRALNHGETEFLPLTVVVDEAPDVADECSSTFPTLFKRVSSVGRELRISLIILSQRSTVKPLGIVGDGQSRDNFTKILMGSFARRAVPRLAGQHYCAVLDVEGEQHILDVSPLPIYAQMPLKAGVVSGIALSDTSDDTRHTRGIPGMPDPPPGMHADTSVPNDTRYTGGINTTAPDEPSDEQIRRWFTEGMSKRKIKDRLRGSQQQRQERLNRVLHGKNLDVPAKRSHEQ
jgi:hypothetical protein